MSSAAPAPLKATALVTKRFTSVVLAAGILALLAYGVWMGIRIHRDPRVIFLTASGNAEWIQADDPVSLDRKWTALQARGFKTKFSVNAQTADAVLRVRTLQRFSVLIDGAVIAIPPADPRASKAIHHVQLAPHLKPGPHELTIFAQNDFGPIVLWASCDALNLHTSTAWESTADGATWKKVRRATERPLHPIASEFGSPAAGLKNQLPLFAAVFILAGALTYLRGKTRVAVHSLSASNVRWLALGAWVAMAANNILKLPAPAGFDITGHLDYVDYLLKHHRIPLANDGWQMFQSPLNYIATAVLHLAMPKFESAVTSVLSLRLLPLACGLVHIQLCYRAVRRLYPNREDLQIVGTVFAGVLPMNIYLSQYVGNEPLAGVLSAAVFTTCLKLLRPRSGENLRWTPAWLGLWFGLALLAKVSAVLVGLPLALSIAFAALSNHPNLKASMGEFSRRTALVGGLTMAVAGWYYVRNLIHLGRPFIGGWDPARGFAWWQDPGFRTASEFLSFGSSLVRPVYAALESFWDGVYASFWCDTYVSSAMTAAAAPKWNYDFFMANIWLSLLPTVALVIGAVLALYQVFRRSDGIALITLTCVGAYLAALIHLTVTLPYYCIIKSFYTIGAMPAYALLLVGGFDFLGRYRAVRPVLHGLFACWAVSSYIAYFVRA